MVQYHYFQQCGNEEEEEENEAEAAATSDESVSSA
jgi:hypothetical protein